MEFSILTLALEIILVALGGSLILWGSFQVGRMVNFPSPLRWVILVLAVLTCFCSSITAVSIFGLATGNYLPILLELGVRALILGLSIGQMFGGKIHSDQKKKESNGGNKKEKKKKKEEEGVDEDEEEEGEEEE